ncbi:MBL fold metallo-hydrolase [Tomitella biformata]|uniref:MBL fold metallo-hydrolase n=1 Tax=Tomitella biformata TaxID=630403 RepID=UPI00046405B7|nr:MBL fold metallo-hydrolase [Tomitella biformata]
MTLEWVEPGCHPVADGVYRIPLTLPQDGLRAVNVYVLETDSGLALIDGGWHRPDTYLEFSTALAEIGRSPDEVHDVYVTHIHRDHYTFAVELRRRHGARVHLGSKEAAGLDEIALVNSNVPETSLGELRRAGAPQLAADAYALTVDEPFDLADWETPDGWLSPGMLPLAGRNIEAVHTPGHTKGHIVFHDHDNSLSFTGDHILPRITPSIGFELGKPDLPLGRFLDSLTMMADDDTHTVAPAHGAVGGKVGSRARDLLRHHDVRLDQILEILDQCGPQNGHAVASTLTWTGRNRSFASLDTLNQMFAVCETMAHLNLLVVRGELSLGHADEVSVYS